MYRKIASLLKNNFNLMEALERTWQIESKGGQKKSEPFAIVIRAWMDGLERGFSFGEAVANWVPSHEALMMSVGDVSKLSDALEDLTVVSVGVKKIRKSFTDALSYPAFLFIITAVIIIMVGLYLVPPLSEAAGGDIVWRGTAASLVAVAGYTEQYWRHLLVGVISIFAVIWWSLPRVTGKLRVFLDRLPPWNMYKVSSSVAWLMSLSSMVSSGTTLPEALRRLAETGNRYLKSNIEPVERYIENGYNLGQALNAAGRHYPNDEIIGDLEIYADMNDFDKNLSQIANEFLNQSIRRMESLSGILNSIGILFVSVAIAWVVFGTFDMQEQITNAMS